MFEERKLHPIALIKEIIVNIRQNIVPIFVGFFSAFQAIRRNGFMPTWLLFAILLLLALLILAPAILKYLTYRYTLEDEGIRIKYGLIFRKNIFIPYERIQTIQQKQWFFYMPFNVTQILIETAGTKGKAEGDLSAVPKSVATELRDLREGKQNEMDEIEKESVDNPFDVPKVKESEKPIRTIMLETKQLLLMAVTSSGVLGGFLILLAIFGQFQSAIPDEWLSESYDQIARLGILMFLILAALALLFMWGVSIIATLFKYFQFKVKQFEHHLEIEKGLLQRNHTTIRLERIQGILITESPFRQMLGLVAVKLITAGSSGDNEHSGDILLLPIMKKKEALRVLLEILPNYHITVEQIQKAPKTSLKRFVWIYFIWTIIPAVAVSLLFYPFGLIALLIPLLAIWKAICSYRATAFGLGNGTVLFQARPFLSKTTYLVRKERIQSMQAKRSLWMERSQTNHMQIAMKSGNGSTSAYLRYLESSQATDIYTWYRPES
ncbi:YbtB protein [Listeria fleischmannii 1991]|uniref:Bacterial membrane flanked domain n=2 Tax=Listeria fleischmannii TaxID=1069827 RepID=A0A2X3HHJ7_9LIST|nr:PH domain-containing protein [Listeria fleischmannii]EMG26853.1 YbtB protein [Listeria fleischmannii subsp. fleischmannii LU2006-1]KMT58963.1 YbtB protein [Listeria fleischmannii 1991]SQC72117.1 Bacterial membrane flanked domain [Listeria fleischmannii subsp. fleischmannii]